MKNILVSSIPSWSQQTGANTFSSMLEGIDDVNISNIYFRADIPDSNVSKKYFHIIENRVIKSIFNRKIKTGEEVEASAQVNISDENRLEQKRYSYFSRNRNCFFLWGRELLWKLGRWKSSELDKFLDEINPDIFMLSVESYPYFNRVNEYIIKRCRPKKIIIYWWDDNFTYKQSNHLSYYISRFFIRRAAKRIMKHASNVLAISPKMKQECDSHFGVSSIVIAKPVRSSQKIEYRREESKPIRFLYTGSMVIGRQKTLISLARMLQRLNANGQKAILEIYSKTTLNKKDADALNIPGTCEIKGQISQSRVFEEQINSDVLVFVESFDDKVARLSFSTKITDYLSSGRCILAIGPQDISSMEYLNTEDAAITCFNENQLNEYVTRLVTTPELIGEYAEKAWLCGQRNHNKEHNKSILRNILFQ
jgi:hypothetical protein